MPIPIVWLNSERMSFACCHFLNTMLDRYPCVHYSWIDFPESLDGGVVIFHGGGSCGAINVDQLNDLVSRWHYVIFISVGDEAQEFPTHLLSHPNMKMWVQAPIATTVADRYLIQGYPAHTLRAHAPKNVDWFFAGQMTHNRRCACVDAMRSTPLRTVEQPSVGIFPTDGFGQGMQQEEYLWWMSRARIAPCPAGPSTVDTFRVYEALECGAIPILDAVSLRDCTRNVWPLLLGPDHPLPIIDDWATLPSLMARLLADYDSLAPLIASWWRVYKLDFQMWLARDLIALGALPQ